MKRYIPEFGEIWHDDVRQYLQEDMSYILEILGELVRQRSIVTLSGEPALYKHIGKLEDLYHKTYSAFLKRWGGLTPNPE